MNASIRRLLPALLTGCGAPGALDMDPTLIDWGDIDFQDEACFDCECDDHCGPTDVTLRNAGEAPLNVWLPDGLDAERFCLKGFEDVSDPIEIPTLDPGDSYLLELSICGYVPGEQTLLVQGEIIFHTDGDRAEAGLSWSYTPLRDQAGD